MSGGVFDYNQFHIRQIREEIQSELDNQGNPYLNSGFTDEFLEKMPEYKNYPVYPDKVQKIMKDAIKILKQAEIYAQRIDWYLSGDDSEESLYKRLEEELDDSRVEV